MNRLSATEVQNQRDFETILDAILSPNTTNEKIKEAEALLKELETRSLENLINCIIISLNAGSFPELGFASASRPEYRQLSATILYRILCKEKYDEARDTMYHHWERLSQPLCGRVLDGLINFISTENTANIMNQVFYATACLMRIIMKCHGQWPRLYELLNTFIPMPINGTPIVTMETAPNVLKGFKLYTNLVNEVMNDVGTQLGLICVKAAVFLGARPEDPRVCVDEETLNAIKDEAFATATGIMKYTLMKIRPENVSNSMAYAMISYIDCLSVSIEKNGATPEREHHLLNVLGLMTDAAWFRSRELYNKVKILTNLTTSIIESERLSEDVKKRALELLTILCEFDEMVFNDVPELMDVVLKVLVKLMLQVPDDSNWESSYDSEEEEESEYSESLYLAAESHLAKLSASNRASIKNALNSKLCGKVKEQLESPQGTWKSKYVGLMAASNAFVTLKFCRDPKIPEQLLDKVLEYIECPHPRVRWSAANCLGEFCNSFFYLIEESKRNAVLDALLRLIKDTVPRVATHTVRCLTDFINADRTNVISAAGPLGPYKDRIIEGLKEFLSTHQTLRPQEEAMRTLIIIIRKLGRDFAPYYDPMMGYFQKVMSCVTSQEGRTLRGLALEAASLSGKVVGKERFEKDAKFVLGEMVKVNMTDHTDPQVGCVEAALCLFAEILGEDFAEFMPYVIPNVIASAGMDVPSQEVDMEDNDNDKDDDYYYEGDKIIRFYRGQAEDKAKHIQSLGVYAYSTRGKFIPYVEKSFAVVMESSKFKLCADVRREAFCTMEYLLRSTAIACMENNGNAALVNGLQKMIEIILNAALECASNSEEVWEVRLAGIRALKGTFSVMGGQLSLTPETAMRVAGTLGSKVLGPWAKDMLENEEPECDDDADSYYSVFGCVQECIDAVFQKQWVAFFPAYGMHLHPIVLSLLSMNTEDNYPAIALKVLCGVVKYSPKPLDGNLFNTILNAHLGLGTSEEGEILQEVCAGIEALAESHNPVFKQRLTEVRSAIMKIASMNIPQGMYDSGLYVAADMAVATLGVIIYNYGANQDFSDLGLFMLRIPLTSCREAGEKAHKLFCVFTQMFYARVMGQNYENVRIVISLLARIIETGFLKQEDRQVITSIVKDLAGKVDENVLVLDLTERLRNILRDFLQNN